MWRDAGSPAPVLRLGEERDVVGHDPEYLQPSGRGESGGRERVVCGCASRVE